MILLAKHFDFEMLERAYGRASATAMAEPFLLPRLGAVRTSCQWPQYPLRATS